MASLGLALVVAGCSEAGSGSVVPDGETSTPATSSSSAASSTEPSSSSAMDHPDGVAASIDPCALLTEEELSEYGEFEEPAPDEVMDAPACELNKVSSIDNRQTPTLGIVVHPDRGVEDLREYGFGIDEGELDSGREFAQAQSDEKGKDCTLAVPLTDDERVDIQVVGAGEGAGCEVAAELAELVEPKLP